jgi:hypothetical protein
MRDRSKHKTQCDSFSKWSCSLLEQSSISFSSIVRSFYLKPVGGARITYTTVQKPAFPLPAPADFVQGEQFFRGTIRCRSRTKSILNISAISGRWNQKTELVFIHGGNFIGCPDPFCAIFTQSADPIVLPFTLVIVPESSASPDPA